MIVYAYWANPPTGGTLGVEPVSAESSVLPADDGGAR
jgi:hypothetical protein